MIAKLDFLLAAGITNAVSSRFRLEHMYIY
jgi:hypothetical protein